MLDLTDEQIDEAAWRMAMRTVREEARCEAETCPECDGSGNCQECRGEESAEDCEACRWTGECPGCNGKGVAEIDPTSVVVEGQASS